MIQKKDISIYCAYVQNSSEHVLFEFFHLGLNAFLKSPQATAIIFDRFYEQLNLYLETPSLYFQNDEQFTLSVSKFYQKTCKELESGRDLLVEHNSYDHDKAIQIKKNIELDLKTNLLQSYLLDVFDQFGVEHETLSEKTDFIRPSDNMFIPSFPHLEAEGLTYTLNRDLALAREDFQFFSWDHPLVRDTMDLIISEKLGNFHVASRKKASANKSLYLEAFFCIMPPQLPHIDVSFFVPPKQFRVLINHKKEIFTDKWSSEDLDQMITDLALENRRSLSNLPKELFLDLIHFCEQQVLKELKPYKEQTLEKCIRAIQSEIIRQEKTEILNNVTTSSRIQLLKDTQKEMTQVITELEANLQLIRLVL